VGEGPKVPVSREKRDALIDAGLGYDAELLPAAKKCQDDFLAERARGSH
jgi:hypothetical protein